VPETSSKAPGWHRDPDDDGCWRFWDGESWTDHTRPRFHLQVALGPPPPVAPAPHGDAPVVSARQANDKPAPQPPSQPIATEMSTWSSCSYQHYGTIERIGITLRLDGDASPEESLAQMEERPEGEREPAAEALLAAAVERPDAAERLAAVLCDTEQGPLRARLNRRTSFDFAMVWLGEAAIALNEGVDVLLLALAARLSADHQVETARAWIAWAREGTDRGHLAVAEASLALASGDYEAALRVAAPADGSEDAEDVLLVLRGRALELGGMNEAALSTYDEAVGRAGRQRSKGFDAEIAVRFVRARLLLEVGQVDRAQRDLNWIQARDHEYIGLDELLVAASRPETSRRGRPNREMRRAVYERDGGRCAQCGSTFDLQYDHVLPVALGGATTVENLQILCGACNQRKSKAI
jgi:tetratricopeptide (TPR) repeat protein